MAEYPSNSNKEREEVPEKGQLTGVAKGRRASEVPEKSGVAKFIDKIVRSETGESLEGYFMGSIADMLCHGVGVIGDLIADTISIKLTDKPARAQRGRSRSRVSYRAYYDDDDDEDYHAKRKKNYGAGVENYADVIFDTRGEAELVLENMFERLERFDAVSVADLYDLAELKHDYQTNKYGWTDLSGARVERDRERKGYVLVLPKATSL